MIKTGDTLVIASHNTHKLEEIEHILAPLIQDKNLHLLSARDLGLPEPEETADTFEGNALLKARVIAQASGHWTLADDSGLTIDALDGQPGIFSARWAEQTPGGERNFIYSYERIFTLLEDFQEGRSLHSYNAQMRCILSFVHPQSLENPYFFEGCLEGTIALPPRGNNGFGYDPIFTPKGFQETFATMDKNIKQTISHRREALLKFMDFCYDH